MPSTLAMTWPRIFVLAASLVAAAVALSGFGARFGWWTFGIGFAILRWSTYAALAVAAIALVALLVPKSRRGNRAALAVSLVIGAAAAALPLSWLQAARSAPPINDITTDMSDPPAFVKILPLRADSHVPAAYPGADTAKAQRSGYPDIAPVLVSDDPPAAFAHALAAARTMGWDIVAADAASGRIEATATTPWFGFKDDVVVRIAAAERGSRIDVRSVSRVGQGDLGANARRIRAYVAELAR